MRQAEKRAFQEKILAGLEQFSWPTFRAHLACELAFYSDQPDPPQLHTLAKNYLDLLATPEHLSPIKRRHLVYRDDRQIKLLSVSYHLSADWSGASIHIEVDRLSRLREDIRLVDRIRRDDFEEDKDSNLGRYGCRRPGTYDDELEDRLRDEMEEAFRSYKHSRSHHKSWLRKLSSDVYTAMLEMDQRILQEKFLAWNEAIVRRMVLGILDQGARERRSGLLGLSEAVCGLQRQLLLSEPTSLDASHAPMKSGDTTRFLSEITKALSRFETQYSWLFPLRIPLAATIVVVPPPSGIDLDNLAMKVIPLINGQWSPPRSTLGTFDVNSVSDRRLRGLFRAHVQAERRFPKISLARYEVIEIPRSQTDPPSGFVRIALGSGLDPTTIRGAMDQQVRKWKE